MMVLITPRRRLGVALDRAQLRAEKPVRGDVHINELEVETLGRCSTIANIFMTGPMDVAPLPDLLDVRIVGMAQNGFVLNGIEQIGDCFYAQSWWCRFG